MKPESASGETDGGARRMKRILRPLILVAMVAVTLGYAHVLADRWDSLTRPARLIGLLALYCLVMGVIYRAAVVRGWKGH